MKIPERFEPLPHRQRIFRRKRQRADVGPFGWLGHVSWSTASRDSGPESGVLHKLEDAGSNLRWTA